MNEKFEKLRSELARQDAELESLMKQLSELADAGVAVNVPPEFFEALDATCEIRRATSTIHMNAVRA